MTSYFDRADHAPDDSEEEPFADLVKRNEVPLIPPAPEQGALANNSAISTETFLPPDTPQLECAETSWKTESFSERKLRKLAKSNPDKRVDFHGYTVEQAWQCLEAALRANIQPRQVKLELVHGIGTGVLRKKIRGWLKHCPYVVAFIQVPQNSGSVIALLKAKRGL